jgi:cyclopropane fatty-acyl-phospholipid synthase-like methyltransferase
LNIRWPFYAALAVATLPAMAQDPRYANKLSPYVASPVRVVDRMLELAKVKPGETLYDLGCGDGIILIEAVQKFQLRAIGVEISPKLVARAEARIEKAGLQQMAHVIQGDLLAVDLTGADVVAIYLGTQLNAQLRPRLEKFLKPGSRVVSHDYAVPGWKPTKVETEGKLGHIIYLYEIPPTKE